MQYALRTPALPSLQESTNAIAFRPVLGRGEHRDTVATLITAALRHRIEAAVGEKAPFTHAQSLADAARIVRDPPVRVLLLSAELVGRDEWGQLERLVKASLVLMRVVLLLDDRSLDPASMLRLGGTGVREVIDLRGCLGWYQLRSLLDEVTDPVAQKIQSLVREALVGTGPGAKEFFSRLVSSARHMRTMRQLANDLEVLPSTLASRFHRARLPSPKLLLSATRLLFARAMLDDRRASLSAVAHRLQYSSPQAFGRHVHHILGCTASEFRDRYSLDQILRHYLDNLVVRHIEGFRTLNPVGRASAPAPAEGTDRPTYLVH